MALRVQSRRTRGVALVLALAACSGSSELVGPGPGTRVVFTGYAAGNADIYTIDPDGSDIVPLTTTAGSDALGDWSPDGSRILFQSQRDGADFDLYVMDADGSDVLPLTAAATDDHEASWSPDGTRIVFTSNRDGDAEIFIMDANGSNALQLTTNTANEQHPRFSPDGTKIVFSSDLDGPDYDIYVMNVNGSGRVRLSPRAGDDSWPDYSHDGRRILFDDGADLLVMNANGSNVTPITPEGHMSVEHARWSPDDSRIVFQSYSTAASWQVYLMDADGTDAVRLVNEVGMESEGPSWRRR